jgi:Ca2+-binding RTX toxin-like protein
MKIDVGSFASDFARPIFAKVNDVIDPVRPFITFLKQDLSFLSTLGVDSLFGKTIDANGDGTKSLIEFVAVLPQSKVKVLPFIEAIDQAAEFADLIDELANTEGDFFINLGSYTVDLGSDDTGVNIPNADGSGSESRTSRFNFSLPSFSFDDFSTGLSDLFDRTADTDFSWPSNFSLSDFSGGVKKLFSQSSLRSTLSSDLDWTKLSLADFIESFELPNEVNLTPGSRIGSSGVTLRDFTTGLNALFSGADAGSVSVDWSKFSLEDFAIGLTAIAKDQAGLRGRTLTLSDISLKELTDVFEPMFSSRNFSLNSTVEALTENLEKIPRPKVQVDDVGGQIERSTNGSAKELLSAIKNGTFAFPVLTDPAVAIDLLLGKPDATLFSYDIPTLELGASFDTSFIVYSPPTVRLGFGGNVGVAANLGFGFDIKGLVDWAERDFALDQSYRVLDGFYLSDRENADGTGEDIDEITAELEAYLELGVGLNLGLASLEAYARGGLLGELGLDFRDTGESTGTSDGKIRAISEIGANITQPWQLFNLSGALTASAMIGIKAEAFFGAVSTELYRKDFGPETLAEFEYGENGFTVSTVFDGPIAGGTVFFDANFDGIQDPNEPFTLTQIDGSYQLAIPLEVYDINGNGEIDLSEGQIVIEGGVDTDTFQDQRITFSTAPDWTVASPMTLLALELEEPDPEIMEAQIETAFGLPSGFALIDDDPAIGMVGGNGNAATVFRVQAQLQNLLILGGNLLGQAGERKPGAIALIDDLITRVQAGETLNLGDRELLTELIDNAATKVGITPADLDVILDELTYLNQTIANVSGASVSARDTITDLISYDLVDISYLDLLETPWLSLLRAAVPVPDTNKAKDMVEDALGLPGGIDIATFDTIAELESGNPLAAEVYAQQVQLNATWTQLADVVQSFGDENAGDKVVAQFVNQLAAGEVYDNLSDPAQVSTLLETLAPNLSEDITADIVSVITSSNAEIDALVETAKTDGDLAQFRLDVAAEQAIAQGFQASLLQSLALGEMTIEQLQTLLAYNIEFNPPSTIEWILDGTDTNDTLIGDQRNEAITGFAGDDLIQSNDGDDLIFGNTGNDAIDGGNGGDAISGGRDNDQIFGRAGFDGLFGNKGNDAIEGGDDDDLIFGGQDDDTLDGGEGDDQVSGDLGNDIVRGGNGDDLLIGGDGDDLLEAGAGDDFSLAGLGNDQLTGAEGFDSLLGGAGDDVVAGGAGEDLVFGNTGRDTVDGGAGNDLVHGGQDDDYLIGSLGDDTLVGDLGNDTLVGGAGADVFRLRLGDARDIIADFTIGEDAIELTGFDGITEGGETLGLTFADLAIVDFEGNSSLSVRGEQIAILNGSVPLSATDFLGLV